MARPALSGSGRRQLPPLLHETPTASLQSLVKVDLEKQPMSHVTAQSPCRMPLGKKAAKTLWVRGSSQKMSPKEPHVSWRLLNVPLHVPAHCARKGSVPAGGKPSLYTSTIAAINRLGDKTKGSFLKMEDITSPVCRSGNFIGIQGSLKAVDLADAVGLREGNDVTLRIFSLFCCTNAERVLSPLSNKTHVHLR